MGRAATEALRLSWFTPAEEFCSLGFLWQIDKPFRSTFNLGGCQIFLQPLGLEKFQLIVKYSVTQIALFTFFGLGIEEGRCCCFAFLFQKDSYYAISFKTAAHAHGYILRILCHSTDEKQTYTWMKVVTVGLQSLCANEQQETGKTNLMLS